MDTLKKEVPSHEEVAGRTRRRWLTVIVVVLVVAVVAAGAWAIVEATQSDDLAVATDLADGWVAGWNADDSAAVAALFTEDGALDMGSGTLFGREAIADWVDSWPAGVDNFTRIGDVTKTEAGRFVFFTHWTFLDQPWEDESEMELDGDLIAHLKFRAQGRVE